MTGKSWALASAFALASVVTVTIAADHKDAPAATADKDADLADVYAWMTTDAQKMNVAMTFFPDAPATTKLSDALQFALHFESKATFGAQAFTEVVALCTFDAEETASCWLGDDEFVTGDARAEGGITSASGKLKVFAGARNDPFFFNLKGFQKTTDTVKAAAASLTFDPANCPTLDTATAGALVTQLQKTDDGGPPADDFQGQNIRAIVMQVDKSLVTPGGPVVGVWGSTHRP